MYIFWITDSIVKMLLLLKKPESQRHSSAFAAEDACAVQILQTEAPECPANIFAWHAETQ